MILNRPSAARRLVVTTAVIAMGVSVQTQGAPIAAHATSPAKHRHSPIKHVVVIYQENHSFDETLGEYCRSRTRVVTCDGFVGSVRLKNGVVVPMTKSPDIVPNIVHDVDSQMTAIDGGAMDNWGRIRGCQPRGYNCLTYYTRDQIPNLADLADQFAVSDRTFSMAASPSWGGHLYAAAATLDGFTGDKSVAVSGIPAGPGWGCDSYKVANWVGPDGSVSKQPSCVPDADGGGAFEPTLVPHVSTLFDSLDKARDTWKIYGAPVPSTVEGQTRGYSWSICPSFADCRYTSQVNHLVPSADILTDAADDLPSYSVVTPSWSSADAIGHVDTSQHNNESMLGGDNWIGKVVSAIESGPNWESTAIFITYDDCGCFYDHVTPPVNADGTLQGPRVPMVIVSPYAKAGWIDSTNATFASILAFTEHTFGLPPLAANDAAAYDYADSFDYTQEPLTGAPLVAHPLPPSTVAYLHAHQGEPDDDVT